MKINFKLFRFIAFLLSLALLSCSKEESLTYTGKVIDLDSGEPIAAANVDFILSDGIDYTNNFINPVITSTQSDNQGFYEFDLPPNNENKVLFLRPSKAGYITDPSHMGITLIQDKSVPKHDLQLAKESYLKINIRKAPSSVTLLSQLKLISSRAKESNIYDSSYITETLDFEPALQDSMITRGYHFRTSPIVDIKWIITTNGAAQEFIEKVSLTEYDTTTFEIRY